MAGLASLAASAGAVALWPGDRPFIPLPRVPQARTPVVGYLTLYTRDFPGGPGAPWIEQWRTGLQNAGYVEGKNLLVEYRFAENQPERVPELVAELVSRPVDLLVLGDTQVVPAVKAATSTIPVVMTLIVDPIGSGVAKSIREPGGNFTGLRLEEPKIHGKRIEYLHEAAPSISRVGVLLRSNSTPGTRIWSEVNEIAPATGLEIYPLWLPTPDQLPGAFADGAAVGIDALYMPGDPQLLAYLPTIARLATEHGLPSIGTFREFVDAGFLMGYAANRPSMFRDAARYVDYIIQGRHPSVLPIELASRFDLTINMQTANALGLTMPRAVLLDAISIVE